MMVQKNTKGRMRNEFEGEETCTRVSLRNVVLPIEISFPPPLKETNVFREIPVLTFLCLWCAILKCQEFKASATQLSNQCVSMPMPQLLASQSLI